MEKWGVETVVGNWDQRENVENGEEMTKCAKSAINLDGANIQVF